MYDFSIFMALVDYIPVLFFAAAAVLLLHDLYNKMVKGAYAAFAAGAINIFCAGFLKATWKLLYAANICDFHALNTIFLPLQSLGFLLAGAGLIGLFCKRNNKVLAAAPVVFSGTFVFIMMMVAGLGAICTGLCVLAAKMKKHWVMTLFILCFAASMGMGYMASHDSTSAIVNWIEQGINCAGQGTLLLGVLALHKGGLADFKVK